MEMASEGSRPSLLSFCYTVISSSLNPHPAVCFLILHQTLSNPATEREPPPPPLGLAVTAGVVPGLLRFLFTEPLTVGVRGQLRAVVIIHPSSAAQC